MALVIQILVAGLSAGAIYGLIAVAFSLVYRLTGVIHFALGEMIGLTVLMAVLLSAGTSPVSQSVDPVRYALAIAGALVLTAVVGGLSYLLAVKPFLRTNSVVGWVGALVAVAFVIRSAIEAGFTHGSVVFPDPFAFDKLPHGGTIPMGSVVSIQYRSFFVLAAGLLLAWAAHLFLVKTHTGRGLRAIAADIEAARLVGVAIDRSLFIAFALAGVMAGLAAMVAAPGGPVSVDTGALLGLKGLAAAVIGRFDLPGRVVAAGLFLGVVESTLTNVDTSWLTLGPAYGSTVPLLIALGVLAIAGLRRRIFAGD